MRVRGAGMHAPCPGSVASGSLRSARQQGSGAAQGRRHTHPPRSIALMPPSRLPRNCRSAGTRASTDCACRLARAQARVGAQASCHTAYDVAPGSLSVPESSWDERGVLLVYPRPVLLWYRTRGTAAVPHATNGLFKALACHQTAESCCCHGAPQHQQARTQGPQRVCPGSAAAARLLDGLVDAHEDGRGGHHAGQIAPDAAVERAPAARAHERGHAAAGGRRLQPRLDRVQRVQRCTGAQCRGQAVLRRYVVSLSQQGAAAWRHA